MRRSLLVLLPLLSACAGAAPPAPMPASLLPIDPRVAFVPKPPAAPPAPPAPKATPVDGALPVEVTALLDVHAVCKAAACTEETLLPERAEARLDSEAPVALWEHVIRKGSTLSFPRDFEVDLLGVVVHGEVELATPGTKERASATMWNAFRAAGAGVSLKAAGGEARVVLVVATSGAPLQETMGKLKHRPKVVGWMERAAPLAVIDLRARPDLAWEGGARHARLGFEADSSPRASLGLLILSKDAPVAEHVHHTEWEILAALEGEGELLIRSKVGEEHVALADGVATIVRPDMLHSFRPSGQKRTFGIQVYTPPGPEQRFRKLAAGK
ncbi:MAG: cupin domain-containing protein [Byssovorax sp.]